MPLNKHLKLGASAQVINFSTKTEVKGSLPLSKPFDLAARKKKARAAYDNAKYRCKTDPDYQAVKFLVPDFKSFLADVGLPDKPGVSLDRINPNGHYEPGNLRWASSKVQAVNKKKNTLGTTASVAALQNQYKNQEARRELRLKASSAWNIAVETFNRGSFIPSQAGWLKDNPVAGGIFEANFDVSTARDPAYPEPGVFHLPSLCHPGERIRLRGGPFGGLGMPPGFKCSGIIFGLNGLPLELNFHHAEKQAVVSDLQTERGGAWVGQINGIPGDGPGTEGKMLALAARIIVKMEQTAAIFPAPTVLQRLREFGSNWDENSHPIFHAKHLLVPDYQIDQGAGYEFTHKEMLRLSDLLSFRLERSLKTWVGIQNPYKLDEPSRKLIFAHFKIRESKNYEDVQHPAPNEISLVPTANWSIPKSHLTIKDLAGLDGFGHLLKSGPPKFD